MKALIIVFYTLCFCLYACSKQGNLNNMDNSQKMENETIEKGLPWCQELDKYVKLVLTKFAIMDSLRPIFQARVAVLPDSIYRKGKGESTETYQIVYDIPPIPITEEEERILYKDFDTDRAILAYLVRVAAQGDPDLSVGKDKFYDGLISECFCTQGLKNALLRQPTDSTNFIIVRCYQNNSEEEYSDIYFIQLHKIHDNNPKYPTSKIALYIRLPKCNSVSQ